MSDMFQLVARYEFNSVPKVVLAEPSDKLKHIGHFRRRAHSPTRRLFILCSLSRFEILR